MIAEAAETADRAELDEEEWPEAVPDLEAECPDHSPEEEEAECPDSPEEEEEAEAASSEA